MKNMGALAKRHPDTPRLGVVGLIPYQDTYKKQPIKA